MSTPHDLRPGDVYHSIKPTGPDRKIAVSVTTSPLDYRYAVILWRSFDGSWKVDVLPWDHELEGDVVEPTSHTQRDHHLREAFRA